MSIIRTTDLRLHRANSGKLDKLHVFLKEYRSVVQQIIDHVWINGLAINGKILDINSNQLYTPSFIPVKCLPVLNTPLSGRAVKCASTQAMSMIKAALKRRSKDLRWLLKLEGKPTPRVLKQRLNKPLVKPCASGISAELSSICASLAWTDLTSFDGWLTISSIGKSFSKIEIPVKRHRHLNKLSCGKQLASLLVSETKVDVRFSITPPARKKTTQKTVGADTGLKTVLTLSDGQRTPKYNNHGYSLESICSSIARKRKGSKAFSKAQKHRTNFINWSINQLNFSYVKEVRLEKVSNINHGRRVSRLMQSWTNSDIQRKVVSLLEEQNVSVKLQSSAYRSQRCSSCGIVRKANRKGKIYSCNRCGFVCDADLNAAHNHEQNLPPIPDAFFRTGVNTGHGFLWTSSGCSLLFGAESAVSLSTRQA